MKTANNPAPLSATPPTHHHSEFGYPLETAGRIMLFVWSLFLLAGFALAVSLEPDPRGYGTHQSLGLPPCSFRVLFGAFCPSCGMTTSFAHFVRGDIAGSAAANPAGLYLACVCAAMIPWCWLSIHQRRLWRVVQPDVAAVWLIVSIVVTTFGQWVYRCWPF